MDQVSKDWRSEFILVAETAGLESTISMRQAQRIVLADEDMMRST